MAKKVNINISLPIGSVQIYVDPRKQMQAEKLITRTPQIMIWVQGSSVINFFVLLRGA